jgi:intracellular multiplication protein IcmJ
MRLAPLTLSVCENGAPGGTQRGSCPFCGVRLAEGREPLLYADGSEESSCIPCSLVRHLERETIAEEAVLIWLPDLSQAALNALANGVHRRLAAEGALYLAASPFAVTWSETPNPALEAIRAIEMLRAEAETRLGTSSRACLVRR